MQGSLFVPPTLSEDGPGRGTNDNAGGDPLASGE